MPRRAYLTTAEAAERLGVTSKSVLRWCERGVLESKRTAGGDRRKGDFRIRPSVVERLRKRRAS